ncbi:hypothetical protein CIW83_09315 [Tissierella sp. P1]|uniref:hypothetical protein n=1 Tax=Tissierella sp. P1 TaxID=1280483 RepID=UPI000BA0446F|nr:hypothetical protein [Tissierella sp. P1]OZV12288.1 hypothetical protein CIW83_09315 [Tissierella sp. P1]
MKNYQINPVNIASLVELTANLFKTMDKGIPYCPNRNEKATQMHFVADLLKDLVNTAYPRQESPKKGLPRDMLDAMAYGLDKVIGEDSTVITALNLDFKSFEEALQKINKIMKDYKPPKAGEF